MNNLFNVLTENIKNNDVYFVFPTEISANLWLNKYITDVLENNLPYPKAVAKERFLSWDKFKTSSIKSTRKDKEIIPSIVRKVFAINLIEKNRKLVEAGEKPLFTEIISPQYAEFSSSFADWIAKILPQLALWKKKYFSKKIREEATPLEEDYFALYKEYLDFLDQNNLFDSAWETPPFSDEGKTYFIFYPESLSDFEEYRILLSSSNHIKLVTLEDLTKEENPKIEHKWTKDDPLTPLCLSSPNIVELNSKPKAIFFDNGAQELHYLMLYIKDAHENKKIPYEKMAISLTDSENLLPYIERELEKYCIPYTTRIGKPMGKYLSGRLFSSIQNCYKNKFSFASIQNLLTNESVFWKYSELNQELVNFGIANNCFCAYEDEGEIQYPFLKAFESDEYHKTLKSYYESLHRTITSFCEAKTFADFIKYYWEFKNHFLEEFSAEDSVLPLSEAQIETNAVLGKIIDELSKLISLEQEKNFYGLKISSCFDFFVDYINDKEYLAEAKSNGVSIYPYRVAAAAPFDLHIIPNATQSKLSVVFPRLSFMPKNLKEEFEILDTDISSVYIKMYLENSLISTFYSASTFSYSGYSIIHSLLKEEKTDEINPFSVLDQIVTEKDFWLSPEKNNLKTISKGQKSGFENWQKCSIKSLASNNQHLPLTQELIDSYFVKDQSINVSATILNAYYECPKKMLFSKVQRLYNEKEEAELSSLDTGTILHLCLQSFFNMFLHKEIENFSSIENKKSLIEKILNDVISQYDSNPINKKILESQQSEIKKNLVNFLEFFTNKYQGFRVYGVEKEFSEKLDLDNPEISSFPMDIKINGKIDLILEKDYKLYIVDYKSWKTPSISSCWLGENGENPSNVQLAFYTYLLEKQSEQIDIEEAFFISIGDEKETVIYSQRKRSKPRKEYEPTMNRIKEMTFDFAKRILSKNLGLDSFKIKADCNKCSYKKTCRSLYSVSGRNKYSGEER